VLETSSQRLRQAAPTNLLLRALDWIHDTVEACPTGVEVEQEPGGAGVTVSGLTDRARVQEPAPVTEVDLGAGRRVVALRAAAVEAERERDVAVSDENEGRLGGLERGEGDGGGENVLPHRISGARVVELGAGAGGGGAERRQEARRLRLEHAARPPGRERSVRLEEVEVELAERGQVVVPDEGDVQPVGDPRVAAIGARPVPYEVTEEPELVERLGVDRLEHGVEGVEISVDVRDDGDAHERRATLAKGLVVAMALVAWIVAGALLWRTKVPPLDLPRLDPEAFFGAAQLERIAEYRRVTRTLLLGSLALEVAVVGLFLAFAGALATKLRRVARGAVRTGVGIALAAVLAVWLVGLPLSAGGHWWARRYDLSRQGYGGWLADQATQLGIRAVLVAIAVAGAMALARRLGPRWWLAGAPALVGLAVLFVVLQPLVIQPLTNRFQPLGDRALAREIERLAAREGVDIDKVEVADASRRTTTANAYVAGIGPTRRVVLYDTILDGRFPRGELLAVAAHELAHVGRRHLWKGLGWLALLAVPGVVLLARVTERKGGLRDPAVVPLGLLVALLFYLGTLPLQNLVSRRYEAEADWLALQATHDPQGAIGLERRFVTTSLADPTPPRWVTFWFGTHPPALERIAMARAFGTR
jgi:Zn-dependent protease with chaperone function